MSEKRFRLNEEDRLCILYDNRVLAGVGFSEIEAEKIVDKLNEQQATIQSLKERLYEFEKRKIIEESEIDEDVIPKVKLLRTELFGEKYE